VPFVTPVVWTSHLLLVIGRTNMNPVHDLKCTLSNCGTRGSIVAKVLCYKPEGRRFDIG
jgi:hypothetical protein